MTAAPVASVVIPAYNEGRVLARCLDALVEAAPALPGPLEIVVAANGCTDDTVAVARRYPGVTVLDLPTPGKAGALRAADEAATAYPRIYLDADVVLSRRALTALVADLTTDRAVVASPPVTFHTRDSDAVVRAFYRVYERLPYVREGMIGLGVYGLSRAGRARFTAFPDVQADDLFVQRLFAGSERLTSAGAFTVHAPRDAASLLKVRTRVARGNAELAATEPLRPADAGADFAPTTGSTLGALARLVAARPRLLPAAGVYVGVGALARRRAARRPVRWDRDDSTR